MFQLTDKIPNVFSLHVFGNDLFLKHDTSISVISRRKSIELIFDSKINSILSSPKSLFFKSRDQLYKIRPNFEYELQNIEKGDGFAVVGENKYLIFYHTGDLDDGNIRFRVKLISQNSCIWDHEVKQSIFHFSNSELLEILDKSGGSLNYRKLDNFELLWSYSFGDDMNIYGPLYLVDQVLIFRTNTAHLIGLDIETGKELWRLEKCNRAFHILEEQQKMFSLQTNRYQVIDPIKGEKVIEKRFEDMEEKLKIWPSSHLANVYPEGLHFVSNYQGTRFGMVDIYNSEIAWVQDHNPEAGRYEGLAAPVLHQDKLYLHEARKTLYLYERV